MAARRYEIALRVLKNISLVRCAHSSNIFSTREEKFRIFKRHIFTCEDNMLFSLVKISSFPRKLTWYFIGVYIIKTIIICRRVFYWELNHS